VSHICKSASSRPSSSSTSLVIALVLPKPHLLTVALEFHQRGSCFQRHEAPSHHASSRQRCLGISPPVCSLEGHVESALTGASTSPSLLLRLAVHHRKTRRTPVRALDQKSVRLVRLHFVPSASWGIPSREGLALPISLCGCSTIPVRGGTRIASLHQSSVVSSSTLLPPFSPLSSSSLNTLTPLCFVATPFPSVRLRHLAAK
jgi:hypothetical protein